MELCMIMWSVSTFVNLSFWSLMHWCDDVVVVLIVFQVVLANGDIVKTASRARKSAAGFVIFLFLYLLINFTCNLPLHDLFERSGKRHDISKLGKEKTYGIFRIQDKYMRHFSTVPSSTLLCWLNLKSIYFVFDLLNRNPLVSKAFSCNSNLLSTLKYDIISKK